MAGSIKPRLLKGFRDYPPAEVLARRRMMESVRIVFERYGFSPLETPAIEPIDILLGHGAESNKQIYRFTDTEENEVGLRFDLTVPLARFVAMNRELPRPFKRYQAAPVWRADKPDPGRFREFIQFDIDTVGSASMAADAELIAALTDVMGALGVARYQVRINHRKILQSLLLYAGIDPSRAHDVFRVLDKREKQGKDAVRLELTVGRTDKSGDKIPGLGLAVSSVDRIEEFLALPRGSRKALIAAVEKLFAPLPEAAEGIAEIGELDRCLDMMGKGDDLVGIDLTIARGLDYYTGPVFETILLDLPDYGSVASGGRYDRLIGRFMGEDVPATGISIGIDRLFAALTKLGVVDAKGSATQALVTVMDRELMNEYQTIAAELRSAGINTALYLGNQKALGKQLQYADRAGIPLAVIMGSNEHQQGEVTIKDLRVLKEQEDPSAAKDRKEWLGVRLGQQTIPRARLLEEIKGLLIG